MVTGVLRAGGAYTCGGSDPLGCSGEGTAWALVQLQEAVVGTVSWTMYAHGPSVELTGHWPVTSAVVSRVTKGAVLGKILPPCCAWGPRTYRAMASHRDPFCPSVHRLRPSPPPLTLQVIWWREHQCAKSRRCGDSPASISGEGSVVTKHPASLTSVSLNGPGPQ